MKKFIYLLAAAMIISFSPYTTSFNSAYAEGGGGGSGGPRFIGDFGDYFERLRDEYRHDMEEFILNISARQRADLLMANRSHINEKDAEGRTALMQAVDLGDADVVKVLLNRGADINARDKDERTPLMFAVHYGSEPEIASILLQAGADVNAKDNAGWTPLIEAASSGGDKSPEIVSILLKAGADVNAQERSDGMTALMRTVGLFNAGNDKFEIASMLVEAGADLNIKDNDGKTARDLADGDERLIAILDAGQKR